MKTVLITGGAGFIGSNFVKLFLKEHSDYKVINLDKLTYAADVKNIEDINDSNYLFIEGDICDKSLIESLFAEHKITDVIHLAAESHVDNSISGPEPFIITNIQGTFNLLETARKNWQTAPFKYKENCENNKFLHISTDEVYGTLGATGLFTETTPYAPNSPYSASKASSDMLVRSYFHTFGMNTLITNCSNNYGPNQHQEKLIPTIIRKAAAKDTIPIYGDGKNVRDWLFVEDHCSALNTVFNDGRFGETYNVGGDNEQENIQIAKTICSLLDEIIPQEGFKYNSLIKFVGDRPGHDFRYAIDASKIKSELGWKAETSFEKGIQQTIQYYLKKFS